MKHKVSELAGLLLDRAVAKAEGVSVAMGGVGKLAGSPPGCYDEGGVVDERWGLPEYAPSTRWEDGGPIIEREQISVFSNSHGPWNGMMPTAHEDDEIFSAEGPTPLIAAMRAYVASRFGDDVDLPD